MSVIPPNNNTGLLIDDFINYANAHLSTIQGIVNTTSLYPPLGTPGPGVLNWSGYYVAPAQLSGIINVPSITPELLQMVEEENKAMDDIGYPIGESNPYTMDETVAQSTQEILEAKSEDFIVGDAIIYDDTVPFNEILDEIPPSSIKIPGNNPVDQESPAYKAALAKLKNNTAAGGGLNWFKIAAQVIRVCEGGYYHPDMKIRNPKGFAGMLDSGETMMGIDRRFDNKAALNSPAGLEFWRLIDAENARYNPKWKNEYLPPDPLFTKLAVLVASMQKPQWDEWFPAQFKGYPELQKVILSNDLLAFHFIYGIWNGSGWFNAFARICKEAWNGGMRDGNKLALYITKRRINNAGVYSSNLNKTIAQGGIRICEHYGIKPSSLA
jgi:hypothetical protein